MNNRKVANTINQSDTEGSCGTMIDNVSVAKKLVAEFVEEIKDFFEVSEMAEMPEKSGLPYSDRNIQNRGGQRDIDELEREICKALHCRKIGLKFLGASTGLDYYYFISCMKWFCEKCGSKGGDIHKKRMSGIFKRVESILDNMVLLQFVFTVPDGWRSMFLNRKAINSLLKMAEKIIKKEYSGLPSIAYFHGFGEKKEGYNPHVNIHVIESKGKIYRINQEKLEGMKKAWIKALKGFGCRGQYQGNVFYQFYQGKERIAHKLSYMSRPCPGYIHFRQVRKDEKLSRLFVLEMKGFRYIRYFNGFAFAKQKDVDRKEEIKEITNLAGERLKYQHGQEINRACFNMKYMGWDYEELKEGLYRIKVKEKGVKKKYVPVEENEY